MQLNDPSKGKRDKPKDSPSSYSLIKFYRNEKVINCSNDSITSLLHVFICYLAYVLYNPIMDYNHQYAQ